MHMSRRFIYESGMETTKVVASLWVTPRAAHICCMCNKHGVAMAGLAFILTLHSRCQP